MNTNVVNTNMLRQVDNYLSNIDVSWVKEPFSVAGIEFRRNYISGSVISNGVRVTFHAERREDGKQVIFLDPLEDNLGELDWKLVELVQAIEMGWRTKEKVIDVDMFCEGAYDYIAVTEAFNDHIHVPMELPAGGSFLDGMDGQQLIATVERKYNVSKEEATAALNRWKAAIIKDSKLEYTVDEASVLVSVSSKQLDKVLVDFRLPNISPRRWHLGLVLPTVIEQTFGAFYTHALTNDRSLLFYGMFDAR